MSKTLASCEGRCAHLPVTVLEYVSSLNGILFTVSYYFNQLLFLFCPREHSQVRSQVGYRPSNTQSRDGNWPALGDSRLTLPLSEKRVDGIQ